MFQLKKAVSLFLCILLTFSLAVPTFADVIWEPDTPFYNAHRDECMHNSKDYYINGTDGKATVYDIPNGKAKYTIENDAVVHAEYRYENWVMLTSSKELYNMWVSLDELESVYDYWDYLSEHTRIDDPSEVVWGDFDGDYVILWDYPGSIYYRTRRGTAFTDVDEYSSRKWNYYADENGVVYLYLDYHYGRQEGFIRISDPCSTNTLSAISAINRDTLDEEYVIEKVNPPLVDFWLPALLVLCTIALSIFLLVKFHRGKVYKGKYS